jgi:hypothetical protein
MLRQVVNFQAQLASDFAMDLDFDSAAVRRFRGSDQSLTKGKI